MEDRSQQLCRGWREELSTWRHEHQIRIGYDDAKYGRPELQWAQQQFVHTQMMVEDRYFYDPVGASTRWTATSTT